MKNNEKLYILWTNGDPITSELMVLMYARNCIIENWWSEVILIVWGSSTKLVKDNIDIRNRLKECMENGVKVIACKKCAEELDSVIQLEKLNIEVDYLGTYLTELIKNGAHLITI